jgi:hypothetical protein
MSPAIFTPAWQGPIVSQMNPVHINSAFKIYFYSIVTCLMTMDRLWIDYSIYCTLRYSAWLHFTVHCYTHKHAHARTHTHVAWRKLSTAFNCPRPQLPASHSNWAPVVISLTHQPTHFTPLTELNCLAYNISGRAAQKTSFLLVIVQLLPWKHIYLRSRYSVMVV